MTERTRLKFIPASGLDEKSYKRQVRAWTMYDWANSAFATTIMAAVLPVYYSQVAGATLPSDAAATSLWSMGLSLSLLIVAILSPILGTISDISENKKKFLLAFITTGTFATAMLVMVSTGDWILASILFIIARIGFTGSNVFYDALLPHIAKKGDEDRISTLGYALGYLGGGLLLAVNVAMIMLMPDFIDNAGSRISLLSVGIWWALFSLPVLLRVPEPPTSSQKLSESESAVTAGFRQLRETFGDITKYKELFKYLVAFLIYNDGIGTIIGVAAIYGAELGFGTIELILALLLVQFVGIPFSLIFGQLPNKENKRRAFFLTFIVFNMIALPLVGIGASKLLPADLTGAPPAPFTDIGSAVGEGAYTIDSGEISLSGDWNEITVHAEELSGTGFLRFVNRTFGDEVTDQVYGIASQEGDEASFEFNGQNLALTYSIGPENGAWDVYLDGAPLLTEEGEPLIIDTYNETVRYNVTEDLVINESGQHELSLINKEGAVMSLNGIEVQKPVRENDLLIIIAMVFGVEIVGILLSLLLAKPFYSLLDRAFGIDEKLDTKRSIVVSLAIYSVVAVWGFFLDSTVEFWFLAWMVAVVQGGSQGLSRSLYAAMSPPEKSGEFFGLFAIMEKFSSMLGPLFFAAAGAIFGNSRPAILSLILFFIVGVILLMRVDVEAGKRVARGETA